MPVAPAPATYDTLLDHCLDKFRSGLTHSGRELNVKLILRFRPCRGNAHTTCNLDPVEIGIGKVEQIQCPAPGIARPDAGQFDL